MLFRSEAEVEQDQVVVGGSECVGTRGDMGDHEGIGHQTFRHRLGDGAVVFDEQDPHGAILTAERAPSRRFVKRLCR